MNAGFQVIGDSGLIQIDQTYSNLALLTKGVATMNSGTPPFNSYGEYFGATVNVVISNSFEFPIIAWASDFPVTLAQWYSSHNTNGQGTEWTATFSTDYNNAGRNFTYYIFDRPKPQPDSHCGLQVFDGNSKKVFDSGYPYLKMVTMFNHTYSNGNTSIQLAPNKNYAVVLVAPERTSRGYKLSDNTLMQESGYGACSISGSVCSMTHFISQNQRIASTGPSAYEDMGMTGTYAIIDVTNC